MSGMHDRPDRRRPVVRATLALAIALALLLGFAWALREVDLSALGARALALPGWVWALATFGVLASHALRAARLHAEWQARTGARYVDCLQLALLHNAAVVLLPLRSGEAGYPWWLLRRWQVPLRVSVPSLLWLRLQDLLVLGGLSALWLIATIGSATLATGLAATVAIGLWTARGRSSPWRRWADALGPAGDPGRSDAPAPIRQALADALRAGRGGWRGWLCATANWSVRLLAAAALLAGLTGLPVGQALPGALAGEWAAVLPVQAPAGFGTYEAGVWLGLAAARPLASAELPPPLTALTAADALAAALLLHLFWLAVGLLAALAAVPGLAAWRREPPDTPLRSAPPA